CSPHNPGGRVWTHEELKKMSEICIQNNVLVVSDEIHSDIVFGNNRHTVYASLSDAALNNSIICTSPSKTFNLAGLQFSNILIADSEVRNRYKKEIERTGYDEPNLMGISAAVAAYSQGGQWFDSVKKYIHENIVFMSDFFKEHCQRIKVCEPEGTYLVWLDFSDFTEFTSHEISERILNTAKVWLDDGTMFGTEGEKFERINAATPRKILAEALERISRAFS
ncbi:MAG: aminotransferase class I/II-fold pyridoxal phosphate-dependent enzyme, partial [Treponema sp.]|nr:aminotransferase class I/II-fold pyridoxal phosphate-dependent enzyme [Treponema sp.]